MAHRYEAPNSNLASQSFELDERLEAIFSRPILLARAKQGTPLASQLHSTTTTTDQNKRVDSLCADFVSTLAKPESHFTFSQIDVAEPTITVELDLEVPLKLTDVFRSAEAKESTTIRVKDVDFTLPLFKLEDQAVICSALEVYSSKVLQHISSTLAIEGLSLDQVLSKALIRRMARAAVHQSMSASKHSVLLEHCLTATLLSRAMVSNDQTIVDCLITHPLEEDELQAGGAFHCTSQSVSTTERQESLITRDVLRSAPQATYNLEPHQMRSLLTCVFHQHPLHRGEAKARLLSRVKPHVRESILLHPLEVLTHAIGEHHLTSEEALHLLMWDDCTHAYKCMYCQVNVTIIGSTINHTGCELSEWLAKCLHLSVDRNTMTSNVLVYTSPTTTQHAHHILRRFHDSRRQAALDRVADKRAKRKHSQKLRLSADTTTSQSETTADDELDPSDSVCG